MTGNCWHMSYYPSSWDLFFWHAQRKIPTGIVEACKILYIEQSMKKIVIGTAGHIDHGKTALVKALTGIDCDRLKVEKERGITTELGFAHYRFGDDLLVGIVDVPGHEKFVRHMVAGAWGIDMVLLVVAADEGVMPQTREHVDICELLGLNRGIVAVTKKDLADDDMVELVREDVEDFLKGRLLEGSPLVPVSAVTGENVDHLRESIHGIAASLGERSREGIFRLPVDRVFTLKGFGSVVTGTCISGAVRTGDEIEIYPLSKRGKVRNIQVYHENVGEAIAGQRVALNLQGLEREEIERGSMIARPDTLLLTNRIDASFRYLKLPLKPLKHDVSLRFHVATTQEEARMIILEKDTVEPGEEAFVQFVFSHPVAVLPGDRFIIRGSYSVQTIGGGTVLDIASRRHKRKSGDLNSILPVLAGHDRAAKTEYHILKGEYGGIKRELLPLLLGSDRRSTDATEEELLRTGRAKLIGRYLVHADRFESYKNRLVATIQDYHARYPQKPGIPKEELRTRLPKVEIQVFQAALEELIRVQKIGVDKDRVKSALFDATTDKEAAALQGQILQTLAHDGLTPPNLKELALRLGKTDRDLKDIVERLVFEKEIVKIKGDLYFHKTIMEEVKEKVQEFLRERREMTPSDFKTIFNISRKYAIPLLEHLDEIKLTIRLGEKRLLRNP
jgi:selenocysteine-specific elongation factor